MITRPNVQLENWKIQLENWKKQFEFLANNLNPENYKKNFPALIQGIVRSGPLGYLYPASQILAPVSRKYPHLIQKMAQIIPGFKSPQEKFYALMLVAEIYLQLRKNQKAEPIIIQAVKIMLETDDRDAQEKMATLIFRFSLRHFRYWGFEISSARLFLKILSLLQSIKDARFKSLCFSGLTEAYEEIGGKDPRVLQKMEQFLSFFKGEDRFYANMSFVSVLINAKKHNRAWELIKPEHFFIRGLKWDVETICHLYARMRRFKEALEFATQNDPALYYIAVEYAKAHQFKNAISLARKIRTRQEKCCALRDIACEYAHLGKFETAIRIANQIKDCYQRNSALYIIALRYADKNKFKQALDLVEKFRRNCWPRPWAPVLGVARIFDRSGSKDKAIFQRILKIAQKTMDEQDIEDLPMSFRKFFPKPDTRQSRNGKK